MAPSSRTRPASRTVTGSRRPGRTRRPAPSRPGLPDGLIAALVAFAMLAAVVAVVVFAAREGEGRPSTAGDTPVEIAHVHGLGVDPASGDLYAGTHYGLIRLPEGGQPSRVGALVQDFMGFTVVGPGHFLASGHPGEDQAGPANLGLLESTDGGRSWQTLSLAGEADFHALEAKHGLVYGYNAGRLMVSADKRTWETRASIAMADLAVSPHDPQTVLATTQQGLARSTDGGRSFRVVGGAPLLALVTWPDTGHLVGVDPNGGVHVSTDGGTTWEQRGSTGGAPEALAASGQELYVAVEGRIVESGDDGRTFQNRYVNS